jgi:peroxiredoxin
MMTAATAPCSRIPDVVLQRLGGGEVNPSAFLGHGLVVIFCPEDPAAAAQEIEAYRALVSDFQDHGVWLLGVVADEFDPPRPPAGEPCIALAHDSSGGAWTAFAPWLDEAEAQPTSGAAFLFTHRGGLDRAWAGTGHAKEVLEAARRRS